MSTSPVNQVVWMEPCLDDPTKYEQTWHCRCGSVHRGPHGKQEFIHHECFHKRLSVIGQYDEDHLTVYCKDCETAWAAPIEASGMSVELVGTGLSAGCDFCQRYVMTKLLEEKPKTLQYDCPDCGHKWNLEAKGE